MWREFSIIIIVLFLYYSFLSLEVIVMTYVAPTIRSVGDAVTAADYNIMANDVIDTRAVLVNLKSTSLTTSTTVTITSGGTYYDISGLSISITPTSATSKIMIWAQVDSALGADNVVAFRLVRDSTAIGVATSVGSRIPASTGAFYGTAVMSSTTGHFPVPIQFLDSPATTSATTYKIQTTSNASSQIVYINRSKDDIDSGGQFRGVSTITVMEVPV